MSGAGLTDIRVGVIGIGGWGRRLIDAFARAASVTICANRGDEASIRWLADHHPAVKHTTDVQALLSDAAIDVVVIATPIETHADLAIQALEAGKHVFVEKPLATTESSCDLVIAAANRANRALAVGYVFLYDDALAELHSRTRDDPIQHLGLVWHKLGTFTEPLVWNLLTHEVAISIWLFRDQPTNLRLEEASGLRTELDRLRASMTFSGGRFASVEVDRMVPARRKTLEAATASGLQYRWADGVLQISSHKDRWHIAHAAKRRPLDAEVQAFLAAITNSTDVRTDGRFAQSVTRVVSDVAFLLDSRQSR